MAFSLMRCLMLSSMVIFRLGLFLRKYCELMMFFLIVKFFSSLHSGEKPLSLGLNGSTFVNWVDFVSVSLTLTLLFNTWPPSILLSGDLGDLGDC